VSLLQSLSHFAAARHHCSAENYSRLSLNYRKSCWLQCIYIYAFVRCSWCVCVCVYVCVCMCTWWILGTDLSMSFRMMGIKQKLRSSDRDYPTICIRASYNTIMTRLSVAIFYPPRVTHIYLLAITLYLIDTLCIIYKHYIILTVEFLYIIIRIKRSWRSFLYMCDVFYIRYSLR